MSFIIRKEFAFSASHQLKGLPETHPCSRLHGHNYVVIVELRVKRKKDLTPVGFIRDYRELDIIKKDIDTLLDHRHLNDALSFNPTAELIAEGLFMLWKPKVPELYAIEVSETPKTMARFCAD